MITGLTALKQPIGQALLFITELFSNKAYAASSLLLLYLHVKIMLVSLQYVLQCQSTKTITITKKGQVNRKITIVFTAISNLL